MFFLHVKCPSCSEAAVFRFASYVNVKTKLAASYFEKKKEFKLLEWRGRSGGFNRTALYYPSDTLTPDRFPSLPEGHTLDSWRTVDLWYWGNGYVGPNAMSNRGIINCGNCYKSIRHRIVWPKDAWFKVEYRGKILWAYNRDYANLLLEYLESNSRAKMALAKDGPRAGYGYLYRVPTVFQTAKARPVVVRKLRQKLGLPLKVKVK